jgi:hypothetical protein
LDELEPKTCEVISGTKSIEIEGRNRNSETKGILSFSDEFHEINDFRSEARLYYLGRNFCLDSN